MPNPRLQRPLNQLTLLSPLHPDISLIPNWYGTRAALPQATIQHGLTCLLTNVLCKKLLARLLSVLCSEHPDFPEPVAQLRSLPISIFIHPLFERAIPTRLQLLSSPPTLPYPGNSPLYSLSLTPLSLKVPASPIASEAPTTAPNITLSIAKHPIQSLTDRIHDNQAHPTLSLPIYFDRDRPFSCPRDLAIDTRWRS